MHACSHAATSPWPFASIRCMPQTACSSLAEEPFHSIRTGHDGTGLVLVVLGPRFNTGQEADVAGNSAISKIGCAKTFIFAISGGAGATRIWIQPIAWPSLARPERSSGFYVATGFNAWGITNGTAAGILVADQILGRANSWACSSIPARPYPKDFNKRRIDCNARSMPSQT